MGYLTHGRLNMYQAIRVSYRGPTNSNSARLVVSSAAGRKIIPWKYQWNMEMNCKLAAQEYAESKGWEGNWFSGVLSNGDYVFTRIVSQTSVMPGASFFVPL